MKHTKSKTESNQHPRTPLHDVSASSNMALKCFSFVGILLIFLIFTLNTSQTQSSAVDYNRYESFDAIHDASDWTIFPIERLRRDVTPAENEPKEDRGPKVTDKKATAVPTKNSKADKTLTKIKAKKKVPLLKKDLNLGKDSASEAPAGDSEVSTSAPSTAPPSTASPPTTTVVSTSTTTTTTTVAAATNSSSSSDPAVEDNPEDNRTGGITVWKPSSEKPENGTTTTATTGEDDDTPALVDIEPKEDANATDPDSGDNNFDKIEGYNTSRTTIDHHKYYESHTYSGQKDAQQYWVNLDAMKEEVVVKNEMLSDSHRRAATVTLTFEFPFYGHLLRNITIATGGFLFTGDYVHTWLAATQYIAPLMANFDTSISEDAVVKYADNGTSFTVQWNNVLLKDHKDAGSFTFQVTLHRTGDIVFAYKQIPVIVTSIEDDQHPVKVGLSDAYIVDRTIFYVRRKTIYEYHKIDMKKSRRIGNWTAILFKALPTCVSLMTCEACLSENISFQCQWCNKIGRCSNGLDRHRQEWLHSRCEAHNFQSVEECAFLGPPPTADPRAAAASPTTINTFGHNASVEPYNKAHGVPDDSNRIVSDEELNTLAHTSEVRGKQEGGTSVGAVVALVFVIGLVLGLGGWVTYAYFYPLSTSGQILIRYRPSTWSWRRGEARYTAAAIHSIHM